MTEVIAPRPTGFPTPLIRYLRVQADFERDLNGLLQRAHAGANQHLKALEGSERVGSTIRRRQIRAAQAEINRELAKLFASVGQTVKSNSALAAAAAIDSMFDPLIPLLESAGFTPSRIDAMIRSQTATAQRGVQNAVSRVTLTQIPLSERVYHSKVLASGQLDNIITSSIARGVSARELGDAVRDFIRPDTPGGVKYAAQRLGRTELNNAFHGTQVQEGIKSPFVDAMRWHLSGSHPRPDECNDYEAGGDLPDGLWSPGKVPGKPHPQCLCWMSAEVPSREEFLRKFQAGEYNDYLVENGSTPVPIAAKKAVAKKAAPGPAKSVPKVGSQELKDQMARSEKQRLLLENNRYIQKGRGKGNYNPEKGWTSDSGRALTEYTEGNHVPMNMLKRDPEKFMKEYGDDDWWMNHTVTQNERVEDLLSKNFLDEDTTVARGMTGDFSGLTEGGYLADPGFLSTTTNLDEALNFAAGRGRGPDAKGWTFVIQARKGTNALPGADYQKEIVFGPGTKQRILSVDSKNRVIYTEVV